MAVKVVTDSTADIPPQLVYELGISVVPLCVIFGEEVYRDGVDISPDLFYEKLAHSPMLPTTSAPSVGDFLAAYEPLLEEGHEVVSIHISSKLSATYSNACQAAELLRDRGRIEVVDSLNASFALGLIVVAAARVAQGGGSLDEAKAVAERSVPLVHTVFVVQTLEYLRRGGRIGRARAFLGSILRVKPILTVREGEVHPEARVRTMSHALDHIYQFCMTYPKPQEMAVGYSTNPLEAEELRRRLAVAHPDITIFMTRVGPVLGAHTGPGVMGAGLIEKEEEKA